MEDSVAILDVSWFSIAKIIEPGTSVGAQLEGPGQTPSNQISVLHRTEGSIIREESEAGLG
jgi:hypothetical protein